MGNWEAMGETHSGLLLQQQLGFPARQEKTTWAAPVISNQPEVCNDGGGNQKQMRAG